MKNLIEGMMNMIFISVISIVLMSVVLAESEIIENRNLFYRTYEEKMVNGEQNIEVKGEPFTIRIPFIGEIVKDYSFEGYTR